MIGKPYRTYVALGDSLSEGLGDFTFKENRYHNGWTDRLAGILAAEAQRSKFEFHFANLAIRGAKLEKIIERQLPRALLLQPDLVTIMAGSNDLLSRTESLPGLRELLRDGVHQLLAAGCDVVLVNTINPIHLKLFKPLRHRAALFSTVIETVADDFDIPVLDVYGMTEFSDLAMWAEDMVHFSGHGHIRVANAAAEVLNLEFRYLEPELHRVSRGLVETVRWVKRDVIPFFERRARGVTSGDGMQPKQLSLEPYKPSSEWRLLSV